MCGPSDKMKNLNNAIQGFATDVAGEAKQVFGSVSSLFNSITGSISGIIKGTATQQGYGAAEMNAINAQIENAAAVSARNQRASLGSSLAAIGGGNVVSPSGLETAANLQIGQNVEAAKSSQQEQAIISNYETGRQNYFEALKLGEAAPNMFSGVSEMNKTAQAGYKQAQESQAATDAASNWWQPMVMSAIGAGASFLTGGISNLGAGESFGEGAKDFLTGGIKNLGGQ